MLYVGTVLVNTEMVQIFVANRDARYVCLSTVGQQNVFGERLKGNLPPRLAALRFLLDSAPPASNFLACHGDEGFFHDWQEATMATTLMEQD